MGYRINSITLKNFKFFYGITEFKFDCKNILIYGENGSGKSSIFWAIHSFLQSVFKRDVAEVQKYFVPVTVNEESVRNRYALDSESAGVQIVLRNTDNSFCDIHAEISDSIVNTKSNSDIVMMAKSSTVINYKFLSNLFSGTNKKEIDLFPYFNNNLLEYIYFSQELSLSDGSKISSNASEWWDYIKDGIEPYPNMGSPRYIEFQNIVQIFNENFQDKLSNITLFANEYLHNDFHERFDVELIYQPAVYNGFKYNENGEPHGRTHKVAAPQIMLRLHLPWLTDEASVVSRPHSFLNEARLSAISMAIRFAILMDSYIDRAPNVIVLDDILLSLDLSNRINVLKIIFRDLLPRYQLIIMTHDRTIYSGFKNYIPDNSQEDWLFLEMYERELGNKHVPIIMNAEDSLSKAYRYFKGNDGIIDYNACCNNQRQVLESIFHQQIENYGLPSQKTDQSAEMLSECITKAKSFYPKAHFDTNVLGELVIHLRQSLNPASHHNPNSNFYKKEIIRTFQIIEEVASNIIKPLIPCNSRLNLIIRSKTGKIYEYEIELIDDLKVYKKKETSFYYVDTDCFDFKILSYNGQPKNNIVKNVTLQKLYDDTIKYLNRFSSCIRAENIYEVFSYKKIPLKQYFSEHEIEPYQ